MISVLESVNLESNGCTYVYVRENKYKLCVPDTPCVIRHGYIYKFVVYMCRCIKLLWSGYGGGKYTHTVMHTSNLLSIVL